MAFTFITFKEMGDIPNTIFFKVQVNILCDFTIVGTVCKEPKEGSKY